MSALRRAWEKNHGAGSVVGLAPSAAAADVLAQDLGISTENTAKWLHEHRRGTWNLTAGQLVIIDEASLAGTLALDTITAHAADAGAKVLLVGDWAQLAAVDAGGAFGMLVRDRGDAPELLDVRRFRNDWEKHASLQLRLGDTDVIDTYLKHDRVTPGTYEDILDAAYQAWVSDQAAGKTSVLIAETLDTVSELNTRARTDRILAGDVALDGVKLHDGNEASRGDLVITRRNDRRLSLGRGWVKNGDRWHVTHAHDDGSLTVRRAHSRWRTTIILPAAYVADQVDLGYAITAHRAQGSTVDTAHAIVHSPEVTRESLYVAMTRGRESNRVYVATDQRTMGDWEKTRNRRLEHGLAVPQSKAELLYAVEDGYGKLARDLVRVPETRAREMSLPGHKAETMMSPADLVAYLIGWNETVLSWHELRSRGIEPEFPAPGLTWNQLGDLAQRFYRDYADLSWPELLERFEQAKSGIVSLITGLSRRGTVWRALVRQVHGRQDDPVQHSSPYANARRRIRAWLREQSPRPRSASESAPRSFPSRIAGVRVSLERLLEFVAPALLPAAASAPVRRG